jgi:formylglycine-generating enzyme required for sulfatase activity
MVKVEGGKFAMGSDRHPGEQPIHEVKVRDFFMGKYPVTQELWEAVMGDNLSHFPGKKNPVDYVSWHDTQVFLGKLNTLTGADYRLPSEAEWEYAARGGTQSQGFIYSGSNRLKEVGWYLDNSHRESKPVGLKLPNELGLLDMSGNVLEWCADDWHENYQGAPADDSPRISDYKLGQRVVRGGSWYGFSLDCTISVRFNLFTDIRDYNIGFRLARY